MFPTSHYWKNRCFFISLSDSHPHEDAPIQGEELASRQDQIWCWVEFRRIEPFPTIQIFPTAPTKRDEEDQEEKLSNI